MIDPNIYHSYEHLDTEEDRRTEMISALIVLAPLLLFVGLLVVCIVMAVLNG